MEREPHELKFAFADFLDLLRRHQKKVWVTTLLFALLVGAYAITRPVVYLAQATFRDKGKAQATIRSSLTDFLFSPSASQDSEAISTMKSGLLLAEVAKELNVQGRVARLETSYPEMKNAFDSLLSEWAYWASWKEPILDEFSKDLSLSDISYDGEIVKIYLLKPESEDRFTVFNDKQEDLGLLELSKPFHDGKTAFTVTEKNRPKDFGTISYAVILEPMQDITKQLNALLVIDVDHDDKTVLKLQFRHRDRHFAATFLNTLMRAYQQHLNDEHELTSSLQVNYLEKRQKDVGKTLENLMQAYVQNISDDMSESGFTSLQREMDFLAANLAETQQKIQEIDLETSRLNNLNCEECVHYDSYTGRGDSSIINHLLSEMRGLRQQRDSLELALQKSRQSSPKEVKRQLEENFKTLEKTRCCIQEAEELALMLQGKTKTTPHLKLIASGDYPVSAWLDTYRSKERSWVSAPNSLKEGLQDDFERFRAHFLTYIDSFTRLLKIQHATLEQRLRTQKGGEDEFRGITLETSKNLYLSYLNRQSELEAESKQLKFIAEELKAPEFELSSLTAILHDPVSHERITKASQLAIQLKDENNRTQKELERIKAELDLQKAFLSSHILQMSELLKLKIELVQDKILALQEVSLELTHQQESLLSKHLSDFVKSRVDNLSQEKTLLEEHQSKIHGQMASIPPKWASEQLLSQNLNLHQRFLENLSNMVESKNITKNLEMIQSAPLDASFAPINPKPPRLAFYTVFGAILGFCFVSSYLFTDTMLKGVPASLDNLRLAHFHTSGKITKFQGDEYTATTPLIDSDLDTLRRLIARFEKGSPKATTARLLLMINGSGPDFSNTLAKLLAKKGQRTLKIQLCFKSGAKEDKKGGLLSYLEGDVDSPEIEEMDGFDLISAGGISRYSEELLRSPRFVTLLEKLKPSYDWIIGVSRAKIPCAEAENLAKLFSGVVIVVTDESLQDLIHFSKTCDEEQKEQLSFVIA